MWLRSSPSRPSMRPMSWNSSKTTSARNPPDASRRNGRSSRAWSARRIDLEPRADSEGAEREPDPRALEKRLDPPAQLAAEVLRIRPLEPHGHVCDRRHAVEVDEHSDQALAPLAVVERACEEARLAVLARRVEPDVVAADGVLQEVGDLGVPVDDLLGRHRARVDERV